jgi:acyl-CoA thioester hydrolase
MSELFSLEFDVRDYECDMEGIVNNAVYQNYLEHARHVFLKGKGIDFAEWTQRGIHLLVVRIELDYLSSLRSGDRFAVTVVPEQVSRVRFGFLQEIHRLPDRKPVLRAKVIGTALNERGRPHMPREIAALDENATVG